jgi:hypothetical protein
MKATNFPLPDDGAIGTVVKFAQATFFDALPANAQRKAPAAPASPPTGKLPAAERHRWLSALDRWFYAQRLKERDAYLAQAQDIFELEARIRRLERRPYY